MPYPAIKHISVIALALAAGPVGRAQLRLADRSVVAGPNAYVLLSPELVSGPEVLEARWSSDSRYVLAVCRAERASDQLARTRALTRNPGDPPGDLSLVVWSRDSHRSHEVWRRPIGGSRIEQFHWLPGAPKAVAIVSETIRTAQGVQPRREVLWIRADSDSARVLCEIPFDNVPPGWAVSPLNRFEISPGEPIALIVNSSLNSRKIPQTDGKTLDVNEWEEAITPIRENGTLAPMLRMPGTIFLTWSASARTCYLCRTEYLADPKQRPARTYYELDPRTCKVQQLAAEPANLHNLMRGSYANGDNLAFDRAREQAASIAGPLSLVSTPAPAKDSARDATLHPLWLETKEPGDRRQALVCADASWCRFSPAGDAVIYLSHGAAWIQPLLRVPAPEWTAMVREDERRRAVADAVMLATSFQRMVGDAEYFPTPDRLERSMSSYLMDAPGVLQRLTYTFSGGFVALDRRPETELGYVAAPGGRAVVYADGHALWKDD